MSESVYRVEGDYAREWFKDAIARRDKRLAVSDDCLELSEVLNVDNCGFYTKSREQRPDPPGHSASHAKAYENRVNATQPETDALEVWFAGSHGGQCPTTCAHG